jgi:hypothetical protein
MHARAMDNGGLLYDDGRIACDDEGVIIRWYYLWGKKKIPYTTIRAIKMRPLTRWRGKWRLWGSGDLVHVYNLDRTRPRKETAIEINMGRRIRPTITPDDPEAVARIVTERIAA